MYLNDSILMNILEEVAECILHAGKIVLVDLGLELHYCKILIGEGVAPSHIHLVMERGMRHGFHQRKALGDMQE